MCSLYLSVAEKKPRAKNQHGPKTPRPPPQREMLRPEWSTPGKKAGGCVRALPYCTAGACNVSTVLIDLNNLSALNRLNQRRSLGASGLLTTHRRFDFFSKTSPDIQRHLRIRIPAAHFHIARARQLNRIFRFDSPRSGGQ